MSARGGRGGRRKSYAPSVSKQLLKRSAQDAGLDEKALEQWTTASSAPTNEIFPDLLWESHFRYFRTSNQFGDESISQEPPGVSEDPPAAEYTAKNIFLSNKATELRTRFQQSPYYIKGPVDTMEVKQMASYNDDDKAQITGQGPPPIERLRCFLGRDLTELLPLELFTHSTVAQGGQKRSSSANKARAARTLDELAKHEDSKSTNRHEGEDDIPVYDHIDDDEAAVDYTTNYYASEDESDGEGNEPTF